MSDLKSLGDYSSTYDSKILQQPLFTGIMKQSSYQMIGGSKQRKRKTKKIHRRYRKTKKHHKNSTIYK